MTVWRPWPYAATAIVQHEWDADHLNIWLIFKYPMDQTVKPDHNLWICEVDDVPKPVTVSAWQDEWTILLTVPDVLALPGRMTLEYDGPSKDLRTTWDKQWEPWGPILSKRVPYLWEDILVVDTVNKRVGILAATPTVTLDVRGQLIAIDDTFPVIEGIRTTNIATGVRTVLRFGTKTTANMINGFGGGMVFAIEDPTSGTNNIAQVRATRFGSDDSGRLEFMTYNAGVATNQMYILPDGKVGIGVSNPHSKLQVNGAISSKTLTHSAIGPTDNLNVSGVNIVFIDCSVNDVTIGGFVGGVNGQHLRIVRLCAAVNDATLEHNEGTGNQNIFLHRGADETLTGEYGGWTLVCNGSNWFDVSHAKHV
ncbi:hypothetical protein ES708_11970 [subsurface metagenome]